VGVGVIWTVLDLTDERKKPQAGMREALEQ
jgi:hypothetical protein